MLDRLLETGARRKKSVWGATASVIVHGTIIALAVVATAIAKPVSRGRIIRDPIPVQLDPPIDERPAHGNQGLGHGTTRGPLLPRIPLPATDLTTDAPVIDAPAPTSTTGTDTALLADIGGGAGSGTATLGGSGVATDASVDVPVRAVVDRAPAYPETLRDAGITGTVRLRFVVDTTGRAELSTVRVLESSHELFTRAVLAALRQARFTPGEVSGRRVRTLVERSFRFDIPGGAR